MTDRQHDRLVLFDETAQILTPAPATCAPAGHGAARKTRSPS
ncbi:hypothetical protein [Streptomyces goshikiensis]